MCFNTICIILLLSTSQRGQRGLVCYCYRFTKMSSFNNRKNISPDRFHFWKNILSVVLSVSPLHFFFFFLFVFVLWPVNLLWRFPSSWHTNAAALGSLFFQPVTMIATPLCTVTTLPPTHFLQHFTQSSARLCFPPSFCLSLWILLRSIISEFTYRKRSTYSGCWKVLSGTWRLF